MLEIVLLVATWNVPSVLCPSDSRVEKPPCHIPKCAYSQAEGVVLFSLPASDLPHHSNNSNLT
jgi:hypothetical protein